MKKGKMIQVRQIHEGFFEIYVQGFDTRRITDIEGQVDLLFAHYERPQAEAEAVKRLMCQAASTGRIACERVIIEGGDK